MQCIIAFCRYKHKLQPYPEQALQGPNSFMEDKRLDVYKMETFTSIQLFLAVVSLSLDMRINHLWLRAEAFQYARSRKLG